VCVCVVGARGANLHASYALAVVAGLDDKGEGYVAGYDAVGSYIRSREGYQANGSAASLLMPILDNVFGSGNAGFSSGPRPPAPYTAEQVVEIVKSVFISGGERDIMLGDAVDIYVVKASGVEHSTFDLKLD
jgi:20S proteasome alpha/beta subunit